MTHKVVIAGAGGIGRAVGLLLREFGGLDADIFIGDANANSAEQAADWVFGSSSKKGGVVKPFSMPLEGTNKEFDGALKNADILLDCLPGSQAPRMAKLALKNNLHYANLTEYIKETNQIASMVKNSSTKKGFILQTGLAPGFVNVLANYLFKKFCKDFGVNKVDCVNIRTGALPKNAVPPHYYGFTWSTIGVATEYVEPSTVLRNGMKGLLPSLTERETVIINSIIYEAALTSGGVADLPDALSGKVKNLDYKTLRYPGHYSWIDKLLKNIPEGADRAEKLRKTMEEYIPRVQDDLVVIYVSVKGKDSAGKLRELSKQYIVGKVDVGNRTLSAIQATTAAGLAESARFLLTGKYKGIVFQSKINAEEFMSGPFVSEVYGSL